MWQLNFVFATPNCKSWRNSLDNTSQVHKTQNLTCNSLDASQCQISELSKLMKEKQKGRISSSSSSSSHSLFLRFFCQFFTLFFINATKPFFIFQIFFFWLTAISLLVRQWQQLLHSDKAAKVCNYLFGAEVASMQNSTNRYDTAATGCKQACTAKPSVAGQFTLA